MFQKIVKKLHKFKRENSDESIILFVKNAKDLAFEYSNEKLMILTFGTEMEQSLSFFEVRCSRVKKNP
ncbi:hypothetical protein A0128_15960 [Leptospira tipperaryensis]|uniref:Uncharacterized protein n=1 Tax=Leptospira tipperaryensis TaxID=2564040 RepID=A0A1D7V043_9LEPT|nr:hypothetical protein A0128_15960 [Leptospira tipperaryensis]